jgi:molybdopterin/thiamine biosynthesis adenylyltransferase
MILTPKELNDQKNEFTVIDIRPGEQRNEFPVDGLETVVVTEKDINTISGKKVLICQFGIVTERVILTNNLEDTYSLLGGVQAWMEFQSDQSDLSRWSRQTVLPEIGIEGQKKLMNATVAIVGMGGLGCPAAQSLMSAGVGKLKLIDGDIVELSNLHRQPLYGIDDINRLKVEVAKDRLEQLNKNAVIESTDEYFNKENGMNIIEGADVTIDATDNIQTRQLIDRFSKEANVPMVYGGLFRYEGQVAVLNVNGSPGYSDLFPDPPSSEKHAKMQVYWECSQALLEISKHWKQLNLLLELNQI